MNSTTAIDETAAPDGDAYKWTTVRILQAMGVFVAAGIAEIGGGWLVWRAVRESSTSPWWWAVLGGILLVIYGFIPTLQPSDSFGRVYAVYGGFFIVLSFVAGWILDGARPDRGDIIGGVIVFIGAAFMLLWPR